MTTVIRAENLGKKYLIRHEQQGRRFRYDSLSESLVNSGKAVCQRLLHPFSSRPKAATQEEFWALKDINFEIEQGDRVGIIGRNGAGKSTLLKILSRITKPTTGNVRIKGRVASLLEVGTGFHPELTGRENIYLNGAILGMRKAEIKRKFDEIVDFAEVEKFLDTPVKHYSSGMYVRLAFAVAAHLEPEILIVDEVLAVGDNSFQKKCMGKMNDVAKDGRTILFVSHNMSAIRSLCNNVIFLSDGCIFGYGIASKEIENYLSIRSQDKSFRRKWSQPKEAPQTSFVIVNCISLCDDKGKLLASLFTNTEIHIQIEFFVINSNSEVGLTVIFYDSEGHCIFSSINNINNSGYGVPLAKGEYTAICKIPKNLFNNGIFTISLIVFGKNFSDSLLIKDILVLEIHDSPDIKGDYHGEYAGCFRPLLEWNTQSKNIEPVV